MQTHPKNLFISALIALTLAMALVARAQTADVPPSPVVESNAAAESEAATTDEAAQSPVIGSEVVASAHVAPAADPAAEDEMRRLDTTASEEADIDTGSEADELSIDGEMAEDADEDTDISITVRRRHGPAEELPFGNHTVPVGRTVRELVSVFGSSVLDGESEQGVVSILGNTTVNGKSGGEAVAVLGNMTVNGEVGGEVVTVLGDVTVNGEVGGEVVTVLGDVTLGETAIIHGDLITIGGHLNRAAGAVVNGNVQEINIFGGHDMAWLKDWVRNCLLWGRPLAFGHNLGWAWSIAIGVLVAYILIALLFPRAVEKCAETLEQRPGYSLLAVLLSVLITPVLTILLILTGVGIILIPFVLAGLFFGSIFGKVVMNAWLGRRFTKYFGEGPLKHVAVSTLIGGVIILVLYTVPFLGFLLMKGLGMLGLGVVAYTLILTMKSERAVSLKTAQATAAAAAGIGITPVAPVSDQADLAASVVPPMLPVTSLPRAGFWIRIAASAIDAVIIGVVASVTHTSEIFLLLYAIYCVVLWALKGTTIGGIVCRLKIVRLDERKVDWTVSIVRGLGGFLSLAVAGLGFIWVAFDQEKQSWHDKIAGTIVVQSLKVGSLI